MSAAAAAAAAPNGTSDNPASVSPVAEHPLESQWAFWEHRKGGGNEYGSNMHKVGDFGTVEDFWRFFNNIPNPSDVFFTTSTGRKRFADREVDGFSLFKKGIRPEWEDPANMHGGEVFARKAFNPRDLNEFWEQLCLGLVGETVDPADEICGARVVDKTRGDRPIYRIEIWFRTQDEGVREDIKRRLADCLGSALLFNDYKPHSHAIQHAGVGGNDGRRR